VTASPPAPAPHPPPAASPVRAVRTSVLVLAYFAFISLGLPDGLLGVGWPSIRSEFGVSTDAVGLLLFVGMVGYLTSSVVAGFTIARIGVGPLLAGSTALASIALAGYALSPGLWLMVGLALIGGFGGGGVDAGLNAYAAGAFGPRHMNWLHAFFGLGVAIGPIIMTAVIGSGNSWRLGYGIVSTAQALLALAFVLTLRAWNERTPGAEPAAAKRTAPARVPVPVGQTLALPALWISVVAYAVYVATEVAAGLWAFLLLTESRGVGRTVAGLCVSGYWASLFVGRLFQGVVAERLGTVRVLVGSMVGMLLGSVLVAVPAGWLAAVGLFVIGFSAAAVFPLLTLTTADRVGAAHADRAIGLQLAGSSLGAAIIPAGIGVLLSRVSVEALGPALVGLSLLLLALYGVVSRLAPAAAGIADR
jgi:fucose permease